MEVKKLTVQPREDRGSRRMRKLRERGLVPGIIYGHKVDPTPIAVPVDSLLALLKHRRQMVELEMGGGSERALIKEIQYDALGDHVTHVDFARVAMDETVTITVSVTLVGQPKGVTHGGVLEHLMKEVQVECLVSDIPGQIALVVRDLDVDDMIQVKDLPQMPGVKYLASPQDIVVHVQTPVKVEEVAAETAAEAAAEPEVLTERKAEEEEEKPEKK